MNERAQEIARLRWRCRRGMRELDVLLMRYMDRHYPAATPEQQTAFESLLNLQDPEIVALLAGRIIADDRATRDIVERLLAHS